MAGLSGACGHGKPASGPRHDASADPVGAVDLSPVELRGDAPACNDETSCQTACDAHFGRACYALARLHEPSIAKQFSIACELGDGRSCVLLAKLPNSNVARLEARAHDLFAASCAAGDGESCLQLDAPLVTDQREHEKAIERACELGIATACRGMAIVQPARAADFEARAVRIWITRCGRARPELANHDDDPCLRALDVAEDVGAPYRDPVRARVREIVAPRCESSEVTPCRALAVLALLAGDREAARATLDRAAAAWAERCDRDELDACVRRAELLNPDLLAMPGVSATAIDSLRDDVRGRDAWAAVCRLATAQSRNEPRDAMACERARRLGADEESLTPPPPPPPPPRRRNAR